MKIEKSLIKLIFILIFLLSVKNINFSQKVRLEPISTQRIERSECIEYKFSSKNQIVQQYIRYYQNRGRKTIEGYASQFGQHKKMISRIFCEERVPKNLTLISQTEKLMGRSSNSLWTFSDSIANKYDLRRNRYLDERKSFEKATRVTAQYLKYLHKKYGSWETALAAYVAGQNAVDKIVKKAKSKKFWTIYPYLPNEVRNFVPNLLATILISENPNLYGFDDFRVEPSLEYELVRVPASLDLYLLTQFADSNPTDMKRLNPELISNKLPPTIYIIRVPKNKSKILVGRLHRYNREQKLRN